MLGTNIKRPPVNSNGTRLDVQEIFATIQGEGPNAGEGAVFIRLGGCNLSCSFCDTEFESFKTETVTEIIAQAKKLSLNNSGKRVRHLIVITGGEPLRQPIEHLCRQLLSESFKVQIETNGTIYRPLPEQVQIICSPKNVVKNYTRIREDLLPHITAFKFIISPHDEKYNHIPEIGQSDYNIPVYIQPMDEHDTQKNMENMELVKKFSFENGYRVSLQLHKIMDIA